MLKKIIIILLVIIIGVGIYFYINSSNKVSSNNNSNSKKNNKDSIKLIESSSVKASIFKSSYKKAQEIVTNMSIDEKIGQLFLVRYNASDVEYLSNFYPGGYILFAKDFESHTKDTIRDELNKAQELNKYKLILGVDEEGGYVTRVSRYKAFRDEKFSSPRSYYDEGGYDLLEKMENEKLSLLKDIGLNLNLAPVSDVSVNSNDFIYNRAFGYDANKTSEFVSNMVRYANNNEIGATLKHFPGYGNNVDTHTGIAIDNRSYEDISGNDYLPFKAGIEEGVPSILVSHNVVNSIDSEYPSSLSKKVVSELREKLGFTGIIMTDDLAMDAVKSYVENGSAATLAINAGCDMIITSDFITMYKEVKEAIENEVIDENIINDAVLRIIAWKIDSNLI